MKTSTKVIITTTTLAVAAYGYIGFRAIQYAFRRKKTNTKILHPLKKEEQEWIDNLRFEEHTITSYDGIVLKGKLLKSEEDTDKLMILVHGYHSYAIRDFMYFIRFYSQMGYHVFLPDNRAHGESEGQYIGFGWLDRIDVIQWIYYLKDYFRKPLKIGLHGISMGGATVLMASGETLPPDVYAIISDCAYSSAYKEFKHQLSKNNIPEQLVLPNASFLSKRIIGFDINEADTVKQVEKSQTPTLFIHGDKDNFVPTYMVYQLYEACPAPKDLLIVEGADHADSVITNKKLYFDTVEKFLNTYIK